MNSQFITDIADVIIRNQPETNIEFITEQEQTRYRNALNFVSDLQQKTKLTDTEEIVLEKSKDTLKNYLLIEDLEKARMRLDMIINIAVATAGISANLAAPGSGMLVGQLTGIAGNALKKTY